MYQLERRPDLPFDCTTCKAFRKPLKSDPKEILYHCYKGVYMPKWSHRYVNCRFALCEEYDPTPESGIIISDIEREMISRHQREAQMRKNYHKVDNLSKKEKKAWLYLRNEYKIIERKEYGITNGFAYDYCVYDSQESEDYIPGYGFGVGIPFTNGAFRVLRRILDNPKFNIYAYIPTDFAVSTEIPCGLCYLVFASEFEYRYVKYKIEHLPNIQLAKLVLDLPNPIWFHKGWVRDSYDPTMYDDITKRYMLVKDNRGIFTDEERLKMRVEYYKTKPCYKPFSKRNDFCKNSCKGLVNKRICYTCGASNTGRNRLTKSY